MMALGKPNICLAMILSAMIATDTIGGCKLNRMLDIAENRKSGRPFLRILRLFAAEEGLGVFG
jgi:hypothetical protein